MEQPKVNTDIFSRLKRLFSNDVIIRNVGGKQLKVIDTEKIQSIGNLKTNVQLDRYNRLYRSNGGLSFGANPAFNYQIQRFQMYMDYEAMDSEAIIGSVLEILSEETTLKNTRNEILSIKSSNDAIQSILHNLFYDILNIEFNLSTWVRAMVKYGDCMLHLTLTDKYGVTGVRPLSVYTTEREENFDPKVPSAVRFRSTELTDTLGFKSRGTDDTYFQNYEIAHFRLMGDINYLPYGKSYLEPARKTYKQYILLKDALMLHQIMRAPEKRVFKLNVGNLPQNEIDTYVQNFLNRIKKTPFIDPQTGDYNLRYNMQNLTEDFVLTHRGDPMSNTIETSKGLENQGATDVLEFLLNELFAAFKVPKSFMGYEADVSGKSTLSAQDIRFGRTVERIQRIVVSELYKVALVHLYMQGIQDEELTNFELALTPPSVVQQQEKMALMNEKVAAAQGMLDLGMFSSDHIYETIFDMSEEEYMAMRDAILADKRRIFRYTQIENEGNDPNITSRSYGTPHDLAVLYGIDRGNSGEVPAGYDENVGGRPIENASDWGTQDDPFGVDPLGQDNLVNEPNIKSYKPEFNGSSPLSLKESRSTYARYKTMLQSLDAKYDILSESNILDIE
jgi:hypothetical protein